MPLDIPAKGPYRLEGAAIPAGMLAKGGLGPADGAALTLDVSATGRLSLFGPGDAPPATGPVIALGGRQVWARMADLHTHLDKTQSWDRSPNGDGSFEGAKAAAKADRTHFTAADVARRIEFGLRCALAYGTGVLRSHLDSQPGRTEPAWDVAADLRERWAPLITLQLCASLGAHKLLGAYGEDVARLARDRGGVLGPVLYALRPDAEESVRRAFDLAERFALPLDFHVDETTDPVSDGLSLIAREALRRGWADPIVCGHCCSLSAKPDEDARRAADLVAQTPIGVCALPMTNTYLLGRHEPAGPRLRAIAPVRLLAEAGVPVAFGSDNCRDAFHPYGDHDLVEIFKECARLGHADLPWGPWAASVSEVPQRLMGLGGGILEDGAPADLVIFEGRNFSEVLARTGAPRIVLQAGRPLPEDLAAPPPFSALDRD